MEYLSPPPPGSISAALFDFDGTISTLRRGWEQVMTPLMIDMIAGDTPADQALEDEVREYIDQSTGIQTIYQMKWLAEAVKRHGRSKNMICDPWVYKAEYNRRLMLTVEQRKLSVISGAVAPTDYMMAGSEALLAALCQRGVRLYVASGTDDSDVKKEVNALGLAGYFEKIAGAPAGAEGCSKEAVMAELLRDMPGQGLCVIGDGKVEISLGKQAGARTLGLAGDEETRRGVDPVKRARLITAGADAITGDFEQLDEILSFMGHA